MKLKPRLFLDSREMESLPRLLRTSSVNFDEDFSHRLLPSRRHCRARIYLLPLGCWLKWGHFFSQHAGITFVIITLVENMLMLRLFVLEGWIFCQKSSSKFRKIFKIARKYIHQVASILRKILHFGLRQYDGC